MVDLNNIASVRIHLAEMHEELERVTELLVDTWGRQMMGDPEKETAVIEARRILAARC